jgi:hypothetical protein
MQTNDLDAAVQLFAEVLQVRVEQYGGGWVGVAGEGALLLPRLAAAGSGSCGAGCMPQSLLSLRYTLYSCRYLANPRPKPLCLPSACRPGPGVRLCLLPLRLLPAVPGPRLVRRVWGQHEGGGGGRGGRG